MRNYQASFETIDEYIASFPKHVQFILQKIRRTIQRAAPDARETIKYRMPTFTLNGNLVHFAGHKEHIGFYPTPSGIVEFSNELSRYETSKGAVRFPLDKPIPYPLIERIVRFRAQESLERSKSMSKRK